MKMLSWPITNEHTRVKAVTGATAHDLSRRSSRLQGGSDFDPKGKSDNEVMRFCQSFMTELSR